MSSQASSCCPICLDAIQQETYLNKCFHKFCYKCITRWAKASSNGISGQYTSLCCPICKAENLTLIRCYMGTSFQQHFVGIEPGESSFSMSEAHMYRLHCYSYDPSIVADLFDVKRYWKNSDRVENSSKLQDWLRREIEALTQERDVDVVLQHILGTIQSFKRILSVRSCDAEKRRQEFGTLVCGAAKPFLADQTQRFVYEMELFLASGLTVNAYDELYLQRLNATSAGLAESVTKSNGVQTTQLDLFVEEDYRCD